MLQAILINLALAANPPDLDRFFESVRAEGRKEHAPPRSSNPHVVPYAGVIAAALWPTTSIFVCWINPNDDNDAERTWVRDAIARTWESSSALKFKGWKSCAPRNAGVRILIEDSGPHVTALGRFLEKDGNMMVLNFSFNNWSTECKETPKECIESISVHEFGHAIGLVHEQNRPDVPGECMGLKQGTDPDKLLTTYDAESVMNYCNPRWNNNGELSDLDKKAVQDLYGSQK